MKISGRKPLRGSPSPVGGPDRRSQNLQTETASESESLKPFIGVRISHASQIVASAGAAIAAMPDVRVDKVNEIRGAVDDGWYTVESEVLAKRMVDEAIRESAHRGKTKKR